MYVRTYVNSRHTGGWERGGRVAENTVGEMHEEKECGRSTEAGQVEMNVVQQ